MENRLAVALLLLAACTAGGLEPSPTSEAIVGGAPSADDPAVVAIGLPRLDCGDALAIACTGVLVAPRVVLTAAHCVVRLQPGSRLEVYVGDDTAAGGEYLSAAEFLMHPDYDEDTNVADLALLLLDRPASAAPAPIGRLPLDDSLVGGTLRLVGFGGTAALQGPDGVKRAGTGTISEVGERDFRYVAGPSMTCTGDSGGPAFVADGDGEVVAGVLSWGDPACEELGVNTRVDVYAADFIDPFVTMAESVPPAGEPTVGLDEICDVECVTDDDCPADLDCTALPGGARCVRGTLPPGWFGEPCEQTADDCHPCIRVAAGGGDACREYTPCDGELFRPEQCEDTGCGCGAGARGRSGPAIGWIVLALWALRLRRRA